MGKSQAQLAALAAGRASRTPAGSTPAAASPQTPATADAASPASSSVGSGVADGSMIYVFILFVVLGRELRVRDCRACPRVCAVGPGSARPACARRPMLSRPERPCTPARADVRRRHISQVDTPAAVPRARVERRRPLGPSRLGPEADDPPALAPDVARAAASSRPIVVAQLLAPPAAAPPASSAAAAEAAAWKAVAEAGALQVQQLEAQLLEAREAQAKAQQVAPPPRASRPHRPSPAVATLLLSVAPLFSLLLAPAPAREPGSRGALPIAPQFALDFAASANQALTAEQAGRQHWQRRALLGQRRQKPSTGEKQSSALKAKVGRMEIMLAKARKKRDAYCDALRQLRKTAGKGARLAHSSRPWPAPAYLKSRTYEKGGFNVCVCVRAYFNDGFSVFFVIARTGVHACCERYCEHPKKPRRVLRI